LNIRWWCGSRTEIKVCSPGKVTGLPAMSTRGCVHIGSCFKRPSVTAAPRAASLSSFSHISSGGACHSVSRPVKSTRNAFSSRNLTSSDDSSSMRSGIRTLVFRVCTPAGAPRRRRVRATPPRKGLNDVVATTQARATSPRSTRAMLSAVGRLPTPRRWPACPAPMAVAPAAADLSFAGKLCEMSSWCSTRSSCPCRQTHRFALLLTKTTVPLETFD